VHTLRTVFVLVLGPALGAGTACRGTSEEPVDPVVELQRLERALADTADLKQHPTLADGDLDPLRQLRLRDPRLVAARGACVRQYETIVRAQNDVARCRDLEQILEAKMRDLSADAGDPAVLIGEAQQACARATTALHHVERARKECDDLTGAVRDALGQTR
jgi:hypothetical protein